ncbi:MAG TPA: Crp/Fnr family transcriptional regulator [Phenylobacterium sp.]|nr:Crp/Fnr family transcriptional regulator [Phenylobacterium sp.]
MRSSMNDPLKDVVAAFQGSEILGTLPEATLTALARSGALVELAAGALLCQEGDPGDAIFIVLEGEIEVRRSSPGGRELRLAALGRGAVAGEFAALDGGARSADMAATRRSRLWRIPRTALLQTLEAEPQAAVALLVELTGRLRRTNAALEDRATLDLGGRLARELLAQQNARGLVALTQSEMARRVGASRERVNRKLSEWTAKGWVEVTQAGARLLDEGQLAQMVQQQFED